MIKDIEEWEVLTPDGWSSFSGIKETERDDVYELSTVSGAKLTCSSEHRIKAEDESFVEACLLEAGSTLVGGDVVSSICQRHERTKLYDLLNVEKGHQYVTNGLVSHNCAHIDNLEELWLGLRPTVSTGGRVIMFSSPAGKNFFYQMWMGAETGEWEEGKVGQHCKGLGKNGFHGIKLPWTVHPERDDKWFEEQAQSMDARGVAQEMMCAFEGSTLTFFPQASIDYVRNMSQQPMGHSGPNGKGHDFHIWKTPVDGHKYVLSADVARGDSEDYSAFHVFDTKESEVVAEYVGKIPPDKYGDFLIEVGTKYNNALIVNELNTVGLATAIKLRDGKYPTLYYPPELQEKMLAMLPEEKEEVLPGFTITQKNREKILENLEMVIRNHHLKVYSLRFVEQMETFIWNGKRGQALKKRHDDLIMAMAVGLTVFTPMAHSNGYIDIQAGANAAAMAFLSGISRGYKDVNHRVDGKPVPKGIDPYAVKAANALRKEFWWVYDGMVPTKG